MKIEIIVLVPIYQQDTMFIVVIDTPDKVEDKLVKWCRNHWEDWVNCRDDHPDSNLDDDDDFMQAFMAHHDVVREEWEQEVEVPKQFTHTIKVSFRDRYEEEDFILVKQGRSVDEVLSEWCRNNWNETEGPSHDEGETIRRHMEYNKLEYSVEEIE